MNERPSRPAIPVDFFRRMPTGGGTAYRAPAVQDSSPKTRDDLIKAIAEHGLDDMLVRLDYSDISRDDAALRTLWGSATAALHTLRSMRHEILRELGFGEEALANPPLRG